MQKQIFFSFFAALFAALQLTAQTEPTAGTWKTWFIPDGKSYRLPAPAPHKKEIEKVVALQKNMTPETRQAILHWNAGAPGYHWQHLMGDLFLSGESMDGILAQMLLGTATYDATVAAWDSKMAHNRPRPFQADKRIKAFGVKPESPAYPCEHAVAAGVGATIIAHFFPSMADSVQRMAKQAMDARVAAGMAFPSDVAAGFDLGKRIAEREIEQTKGYFASKMWDGTKPDKPGTWQGKFAMLPYAGSSKTVVLENGSQFRPGPPPDYAKDMEELKNHKPTYASTANAFKFAEQFVWSDLLDRKMFEQNIHLNAPLAAKLYAAQAIGIYDGFVSCWDAKYAYWGIRPEQYDPSFKPVLFASPPFPGYPSGHAAIGAVMCELLSHFFPGERAYFEKMAKDGAESRFQGGIHFRTDNDVALVLGRQVGQAIVGRLKREGAGEPR